MGQNQVVRLFASLPARQLLCSLSDMHIQFPPVPYRSMAGENEKRPPIVAAGVSPWETQCVLASCQSLALLDGEVVGDPLEKACVTAINWTINKGLVF